MNDEELALVYYNYRYYNPADGRWINKDPLKEENFLEIYLKSELKNRIFLLNYPICMFFAITHLLQGRMY
ncbi:MAG: hypothetical protein EGS44_02705 [Akkermansia muciniphila]|nr:hypothetical protein [Akkermansia muciniphila]